MVSLYLAVVGAVASNFIDLFHSPAVDCDRQMIMMKFISVSSVWIMEMWGSLSRGENYEKLLNTSFLTKGSHSRRTGLSLCLFMALLRSIKFLCIVLLKIV